MAKSDDGFLWVATPRGVVCFDGLEFTAVPDADGLGGTEVTALGRGSGNRLWLGGADGSVRVLDRGKIRLSWKPDSRASRLAALEEQSDGTIRIVDSLGRMTVLDTHGAMHAQDIPVIPQNRKTSMLAADGCGGNWESDGSGTLVYHSAGGGNTAIELQNRRGPLIPTALLAERDGTLWVGTDAGGLTQISPALFRRWSRVTEPPLGYRVSGNNVVSPTSILIDPHGEGVVVGRPEAVSPSPSANSLGDREGARAKIAMLSCLPDKHIPTHVVISGADGSLWVGREGKFPLLHYTGGAFHAVDLPGESLDIQALAFDTEGTLWIGTNSDGVLRLKNSVAEKLGFPAGVPVARVRQILPSGSTVWFATEGSGLLHWKNGLFKAARTRDGLPDDDLASIQPDAFDGLWLNGERGYFRMACSGMEAWFDGDGPFPRPVVFDGSDGVGRFDGDIDHQGGSSSSSDGRIWFTGNGCLIELRPDLYRVPHDPPHTAITACIINGEPIIEPRRVSSGARRVEFRFTSAQLAHPEGARFQCRLAPYDADWVDVGKNRTISYTNLSPGPYQFEVRSTDRYGRLSPSPARMDLLLPTPFWKTRVFVLAAILAALTAAALLVRAIIHNRLKALRERERIEQAVAGERRRIARDMHDELGTGLCEIALLGNRVEEFNPGSADAIRLACRSRELVRVIDETVWMLNPRNDNLENLASYLASSMRQWLRDSPLRPRFDLDVSFEGITVPTTARRHLYLACKEAVCNAVKHSRGDELMLGVHSCEEGFEITIQDNGNGLPDHPDPSRSGLANLRERMLEMGGSLDLSRAAAGGTRVTLRVPARSAASERQATARRPH